MNNCGVAQAYLDSHDVWMKLSKRATNVNGLRGSESGT
jgi:hypothetical protein